MIGWLCEVKEKGVKNDLLGFSLRNWIDSEVIYQDGQIRQGIR